MTTNYASAARRGCVSLPSLYIIFGLTSFCWQTRWQAAFAWCSNTFTTARTPIWDSGTDDKDKVRLDCIHPSRLCRHLLALSSLLILCIKQSNVTCPSQNLQNIHNVSYHHCIRCNWHPRFVIPQHYYTCLPTEISPDRLFCSERYPRRWHVRPPCGNPRCIIRVCSEAESSRSRGCAGRFLGCRVSQEGYRRQRRRIRRKSLTNDQVIVFLTDSQITNPVFFGAAISEIDQGKNLIAASKAVGVKFFVFR